MTVGKIDEFAATYRGSEEETADVLSYYNKFKGDFGRIMDSVMLAEEEDYDRIAAIIDSAIASETVSRYVDKYRSSFERLKAKAAKPKHVKARAQSAAESDDLLQQMILNNNSRRGDAMSSILDKYSRPSGGVKKGSPVEDIPDDEFERTRSRLQGASSKRHKK